MSTHEDQELGDLSLEEMMARAAADATGNLPHAGGDYDTQQGWLKRLGFAKHDRLTKHLLPYLIKQGLAETNVDGYTMRSGFPYRCKLIHSPYLAKQAAGRATA